MSILRIKLTLVENQVSVYSFHFLSFFLRTCFMLPLRQCHLMCERNQINILRVHDLCISSMEMLNYFKIQISSY